MLESANVTYSLCSQKNHNMQNRRCTVSCLNCCRLIRISNWDGDFLLIFHRSKLKPKEFSYDCDWDTYFEHAEWPLMPCLNSTPLEPKGSPTSKSNTHVSSFSASKDPADSTTLIDATQHQDYTKCTKPSSSPVSPTSHSADLTIQSISSKSGPRLSNRKPRLDQPYGPRSRTSNSCQESSFPPPKSTSRHHASENPRNGVGSQLNEQAKSLNVQPSKNSCNGSSSQANTQLSHSRSSSPSTNLLSNAPNSSKRKAPADKTSSDFADVLAAKMQSKEDEEKRARVNNCYVFAQMVGVLHFVVNRVLVCLVCDHS